MRDFAIPLSHKPGELGRVASILGRAGVNIKSVAAMVIGNQGTVRLLADDVETARDALREANVRFEESEVVTTLRENRAGELADVADKLANAGINLQALYVVGLEGDLVELAVIADDPKKAKKLLE
jgi:acetolactate synthase small subunit